jgi:signal transduction histidine kinase
MPSDPAPSSSHSGAAPTPGDERAQTDESLRSERAKADAGMGEGLDHESASIDETADAVIAKARARADAVLARARAKTDRRTAPPRAAGVVDERVFEDAVLAAERASADQTLLDERERLAASLATERKVTDRDLESERARADDALSTRDGFMGLVGHDLRNLLHSMNGFASLITTMVSEGGRPEEIALYAQRIQRSGRRMDRLIGDLVDIASSHTGALRVTCELADPAQIVTEAVEAMQPQASARKLSLVADIVGTMSPVAMDPPRILQVLTNLISNAIKFTSPAGRVVARVERVAQEIRFSVSDTGIGIPPDKLEVIFDRFIQVVEGDGRGHGLGLYISQCIVCGHGGRIWAESAIGKGSTITFALPVGATRPPS